MTGGFGTRPSVWTLGIRGYLRWRRRARAQEALGTHPVETWVDGKGWTRLSYGHVGVEAHDGLPSHRHDSRTGFPIAVFEP